ncbi:hypothetical protein UPYG_G00324910 [Umbra pygmaea]|uniref:Cytochrome P450 26C1 n=1 Tax=Umbra pygmaea TaxID=75934 RepID=A0ABD0W1V0_UMBPY
MRTIHFGDFVWTETIKHEFRAAVSDLDVQLKLEKRNASVCTVARGCLEMFLLELSHLSALVTALTSVVSALILLAVSKQLWTFRWTNTRDKECKLPLPNGSMGWPLVGETFHWLFQGSNFHISRREKHGNVFKTHLLGKPVIRVTGAENIRKILLGEHNLVCTQWPQSTRIILGPNTLVNSIGDLHKNKRKILAKVFSRGALEMYLPRLQAVVKSEIAKWCSEPGPVDVYAAAKSLTFHIAVRILLGLKMEEKRIVYLSQIFEQLINNLFSLPIDAPMSGLRKGIKAREMLHACMEKIIKEKIQKPESEKYYDAFDYMLSSAKENRQELSMQELKETAVELIFAAHSTTASASTSLILQLLRHPGVVEKARIELESEGLVSNTQSNNSCYRKENGLKVSGGYRTALQTFELDGYQIPKGWSVMYSIRDTHETAAVFQSPEIFNPDRFRTKHDESKTGRFNYVPFGGGIRSCVGKQLAQMILKTLAVEVIGTCKWTLATENFPKMQTVPIVHPVNGLHVHFNYA